MNAVLEVDKTLQKNISISVLILVLFGLFSQFIDFYISTNLSAIVTLGIYSIFIYLVLRYQLIKLKVIFFWIISLFFLSKLYIDVALLDAYLLRSILNIIIFSIIFFYFSPSYLINKINLFNTYVYIYFTFNFILYLSRDPAYFKDMSYESVLRFKGVMPDAALFATILEFIFIITLVNIKKNKAILPSVLIIFLIMITGSRMHTIVSSLLFVLFIFRYMSGLRKILIIVPFILITSILFFIFDPTFSAIERISSYNLYFNGRDYLFESAIQVFSDALFIEKLLGINLTDRYLLLSSMTRFHSFGENSFLTMTMLYGIVGLIIYIIMWILIFQRSRDILGFVTILLICITTYFEDTILSTQSFTLMIISLLTITEKTSKTINEHHIA